MGLETKEGIWASASESPGAEAEAEAEDEEEASSCSRVGMLTYEEMEVL